jgi:hypothetical protein
VTTHLGEVEAGPGLRFWLHGVEGKAVGTLGGKPHSASKASKELSVVLY